MFLTDEERELLKKELKWHKISDEKPKEGELCRLLPKEDFLILPIAFLDDGMFIDFDIVGEYHNNATHWIYEKEVDEYLNQFPIREETFEDHLNDECIQMLLEIGLIDIDEVKRSWDRWRAGGNKRYIRILNKGEINNDNT